MPKHENEKKIPAWYLQPEKISMLKKKPNDWKNAMGLGYSACISADPPWHIPPCKKSTVTRRTG